LHARSAAPGGRGPARHAHGHSHRRRHIFRPADVWYAPHRQCLPKFKSVERLTAGHTGKVLNLGADWGLIDKDGTFSADTRYQLQTDDGAHIFIRTSGPAQADGKLHLRMEFETGNADYYWLNKIVAVGVLTAADGYVLIDGWQLESPKK
jgi:hypothetical protein